MQNARTFAFAAAAAASLASFADAELVRVRLSGVVDASYTSESLLRDSFTDLDGFGEGTPLTLEFAYDPDRSIHTTSESGESITRYALADFTGQVDGYPIDDFVHEPGVVEVIYRESIGVGAVVIKGGLARDGELDAAPAITSDIMFMWKDDATRVAEPRPGDMSAESWAPLDEASAGSRAATLSFADPGAGYEAVGASFLQINSVSAWTEDGCLGDLNGDGFIDSADFGELLGQWNGPGRANLDGAGVVDTQDATIMLSYWGECR
jgi:hypothetical protein